MSRETTVEVGAGRVEGQDSPHGETATFVGQLAGAIGNQFNNLMMAVTGYAELELKKAAPPQKRKLEQILSQAALATTLIQKLLAFTRSQAPAPRSFPFNSLIREIGPILEPLAGVDVEVAIKLDENAGRVTADPTEIERLILFLTLHARECMSQSGQFELSTARVELDSTSFAREDVPEAGEHVSFCVRCVPAHKAKLTGDRRSPGVSASRVEPVIATARSIVENQGGILRVSIQPGAGTTFQMYFPATRSEASKSTASSAANRGANATRTILIVDDDDGVRDPAAEFLKMEGFKVLQARTASEALRIVQDSRSTLDLLLTDVVMAGMTGTDMADQLLKAHPGLKVLYMSGDPERAAKLGGEGTSRPLLRKPFRLNVLNDKIRELLGD